MLFDVTAAEYLDSYKLKIGFENGKSGTVDIEPYLARGGVFLPLKDIDFFRRFKVNSEIGTVCWPNGADVAPESLYRMLETQGG